MKTKINYSVSEVGSALDIRDVPFYSALTNEQKEELKEKGFITVTTPDKILSISAMEFKKEEK